MTLCFLNTKSIRVTFTYTSFDYLCVCVCICVFVRSSAAAASPMLVPYAVILQNDVFVVRLFVVRAMTLIPISSFKIGLIQGTHNLFENIIRTSQSKCQTAHITKPNQTKLKRSDFKLCSIRWNVNLKTF